MFACCAQVKRKDPPEAAAAGDNKRARPSTPVDDELEDEGASPLSVQQNAILSFLSGANLSCRPFLSDRDRDPAELPSDDSKMDGDGMAAKRRHSRPLELDSEGEEELDTSGKEESLSDREEPDETEPAERLSSAKVSFPKNHHLYLHFSADALL